MHTFLSCLIFIPLFPVILRFMDGAGSWGRVLGSCRTRRSWVYLLWFGQEWKNAKNAYFGRFDFVSLFPIVL
jgi:hypothetical protein